MFPKWNRVGDNIPQNHSHQACRTLPVTMSHFSRTAGKIETRISSYFMRESFVLVALYFEILVVSVKTILFFSEPYFANKISRNMFLEFYRGLRLIELEVVKYLVSEVDQKTPYR